MKNIDLNRVKSYIRAYDSMRYPLELSSDSIVFVLLLPNRLLIMYSVGVFLTRLLFSVPFMSPLNFYELLVSSIQFNYPTL